MPGSSCIFCRLTTDRDEPTFIFEFEHSTALVNFEQRDYPGYALLLLKKHYDHVHKVPQKLLHAFIEERTHLAAALFKAFPATTRMNYANLGNAVPHVHEHLIPRHDGDHNAGGPPWPARAQKKLADDEYRAIAARIRIAL
ncbi:MAG: HIT family protein [Micavibrio sp.]|nr:HIT family protein [Micavibrio sp.]